MDDVSAADDCPAHPSASGAPTSSRQSAISITGRSASRTTTMIFEDRQQPQQLQHTEEITNDVLILTLQPRPTVTW
jgi:hypothetical protein